MRRFLSLALVLVLCLSMAACGKKTEDSLSDGVLTVAMECAYAPYNWTQPTDANGAVKIKDSNDYAYGYDVMMAKKIAAALNAELEIVKLDWDSLVPAVQSGVVDCVIAGQSITSERKQMVDFSEPYYYASIVTLTSADGKYANAASVADLAGATCTSQINTVWYDTCLPQIADANILPAQESAPAMLVALNSGRCDLVVTDMPTAMAACVAYPNFKLLDFSGTDGDFEVSEEEINIGISMRKGNAALCEAINGVLATMTVDDYTAYYSADSIESFAESVFLDLGLGAGEEQDGVLLVLSMAERDYDICAHGTIGNRAFTDYGKGVLAERWFLEPFSRDDWSGGFAAFLDGCEEYLRMDAEGAPFDQGTDPERLGDMAVVKWLVVIFVPLLTALVVCLVMKGKMKSARLQTQADAYITQDSLRLTRQDDRYITTTQTRVKIETAKSGGTSVNSGGFSHSSGKF